MSIQDYRARVAHDHQIRDAVARATGPGLLALIESGQRLNHPDSIDYTHAGCQSVFDLLRVIADYRHLMHMDENRAEYVRATAALACGHGYTLLDSCPGCDNYEDPIPGELPLITLTPRIDPDA